ncbi:MAG TPA: ABC-type transport auxiliary lipoprotein family protein [Candidatus Sulfotelmatobacter sp.]|nr:ABC-type transport auxiliary lipoprotein family protein [Candidatus Sulfotelmatobacter sp.]
MSRPALVKQSFTFSIPPLAAHPPAPGAHVLEIRPLTVAAPFDSQSFLYRTGEYAYEHDPYAEFLVPPAESLGAALRGYLQNTEGVSSLAGESSPWKVDRLLEVYVSELYGDFRNRTAPAAVLRMSLTFRDGTGRVLLRKEYEERLPLKARTAAALMAGWNEALTRIVARWSSELKQAG